MASRDLCSSEAKGLGWRDCLCGAVPCDEMQELAEKFGKGTWLGENDAGMGVILGGPLLGERKEIFSITRDDDALLARGKGQLFFVGMAEVSGCLSGQAIDAARCENVCK